MSSSQLPTDDKKGYPDGDRNKNGEGGVYILEKPGRVQGIRAFQTPTCYIGSIIVAFIIYHLNRLNFFESAKTTLCNLLQEFGRCLCNYYT